MSYAGIFSSAEGVIYHWRVLIRLNFSSFCLQDKVFNSLRLPQQPHTEAIGLLFIAIVLEMQVCFC